MNTTDVIQFNTIQKNIYQDETGIEVDIQNIGKNNKTLAIREKEEKKELRPGLTLGKKSFQFSNENFTNVYDLCFDQNEQTLYPTIHSSNKPYHLADQVKSDPSIVALVNGSFFFLTDEANRHPKDLPYNFCIRNSKVVSLPMMDDPVIFIKDGKLNGTIPKAIGKIRIGKEIVSWVGERSVMQSKNNRAQAVLYNSRSSEVVKLKDPKTGLQIGILDEKSITTPSSPEVFDLVVNTDDHGNLFVSAINKGGNTHYFDGLFILQMKGDSKMFFVKQKVIPLTLDHLDIAMISEALTIGKSVHDGFFSESVRKDRKDARSLIAEDNQGKIHFIVFDGSKYIPGFRGVSAEEIQSYFSQDRFKWAFFLDGGGSSRIIVKNGDTPTYLANRFIVTKLDNGLFLWDWEKARPLASSISIRTR